MISQTDKLIKQIQSVLTPDLLKPEWKRIAKINGTPYCGHCYHATESLYWLLGGSKSNCKPMVVRHEGGTHWFLLTSLGKILDVTGAQFYTKVPYELAKGCGFLTKHPSKRARKVIERIRKNTLCM